MEAAHRIKVVEEKLESGSSEVQKKKRFFTLKGDWGKNGNGGT